MKSKSVFFILSVLLLCQIAIAEESPNIRYSYPLSIGVDYIPLSPVTGIDHTTSVTSIEGRVRLPIPKFPMLQPFVLGGLAIYDVDTSDVPVILGGSLNSGASMPDYEQKNTWDHTHIFAGIGLGFSYRINKEFETGIEIFASAGQSTYPNRVVDSDGQWYPVGEWGFSAGANGKITLNPTYSFSIDVLPTFRYDMSLGNIDDFDGLYFGLGFAAHYRFGQDPDSPQTEVRALKFSIDDFPPVFAAMQKNYVEEPITYITLTNTEKSPLNNLEVNFDQAGYMDSPTLSYELEELAAGESVDVPVYASFNDAVFSTVDVIPLNGEILTTYEYRGQVVTQNRSVTFNLQDKNALIWDDDRKVAAFITPKDSAVRNFASFVADRSSDENTQLLPDQMEKAMQVYHALAALNLGYQSDPASPFVEARGNSLVIDTVSLPRETLARGTGDCDDITVLYNSMLESINVKSGIVTVPGHIYSAVDTGLKPREYKRIHPDRDMTLAFNESLWVLVEITMIGKKGFTEAWRKGMEQWHAYGDDERLRAIYTTANCQEKYKPVGLLETDIGLQYGDPEAFLEPYRRDRDKLGTDILQSIRFEAEKTNSPGNWNYLGVVSARLNRIAEAEIAFQKAATLAPSMLSPKVNLGGIYFLKEQYDQALKTYKSVESIIRDRNKSQSSLALKIYINIAKTLYALNQFDEIQAYMELAKNINPEETARYSYLSGSDSAMETGRAGAVSTEHEILFAEEVE